MVPGGGSDTTERIEPANKLSKKESVELLSKLAENSTYTSRDKKDR